MINNELKKEWQEYLDQTKKHEQVVRGVFEKLGLDPEVETPGRKVVRHIGESLVQAMDMARSSGNPEAAQIVAAECVVEAETKDHLNWQLIAQVAEKSHGEDRKIFKEALEQVEEEEDQHLYHTTAGAGNCGSNRWDCPRSSRRPRKKKTSKRRLEQRAQSKPARKCYRHARCCRTQAFACVRRNSKEYTYAGKYILYYRCHSRRSLHSWISRITLASHYDSSPDVRLDGALVRSRLVPEVTS